MIRWLTVVAINVKATVPSCQFAPRCNSVGDEVEGLYVRLYVGGVAGLVHRAAFEDEDEDESN
ncbi:hypothetical protein A7975_22950 [Bacillus sp. FJAT-26390]|nr:hypothetical protein A7975_22950 [Bacillus sp. FJAT-26390]